MNRFISPLESVRRRAGCRYITPPKGNQKEEGVFVTSLLQWGPRGEGVSSPHFLDGGEKEGGVVTPLVRRIGGVIA